MEITYFPCLFKTAFFPTDECVPVYVSHNALIHFAAVSLARKDIKDIKVTLSTQPKSEDLEIALSSIFASFLLILVSITFPLISCAPHRCTHPHLLRQPKASNALAIFQTRSSRPRSSGRRAGTLHTTPQFFEPKLDTQHEICWELRFGCLLDKFAILSRD